MDLDQDTFDYLIDILRCPVCKAKVAPRSDHTALDCAGCRLIYPMRNGIPIMMKEQASTPEPKAS